MRRRSSWSAALIAGFLLVAACSSDSSKSGQSGASDAGTGGGGSSGTGGKSGGTGGAAGPACDAADCCRVCLVEHCATPANACFAEAGCEAAYETYQSCMKTQTEQTGRTGCVVAFTTAIGSADSGVDGGEVNALLTCIGGPCTVCGAPGIF